MEFTLIPAGTFMMGSNGGDDEKPVHEVRISRPFYMSRFEVTRAQWDAVMGWGFTTGKDWPVDNVFWEDIQMFITRLNKNEGGRRQYRLPTEAEWEYACRAGSVGEYAGDLDAMGWYIDNSNIRIHPVGQKEPNAWGLYDMYGNVWEWCQDWYGSYPNKPVTDPQGPSSDTDRVRRGGGSLSNAGSCRSAMRGRISSYGRSLDLGFRLVREAN